jgi:hypothetical protein
MISGLTRLGLRRKGYSDSEIKEIEKLRNSFLDAGRNIGYIQAGRLYRAYGGLDDDSLVEMVCNYENILTRVVDLNGGKSPGQELVINVLAAAKTNDFDVTEVAFEVEE